MQSVINASERTYEVEYSAAIASAMSARVLLSDIVPRLDYLPARDLVDMTDIRDNEETLYFEVDKGKH